MLQEKILFNSTQNSEWQYVPDHPYRMLIIGSSRSGKTNALVDLKIHQPHIDKIYLYAKNSYKKDIIF